MLIVLSHILGSRFDYGGECGVAFFFTVSGFVLSIAYGNSISLGTFSLRNFISHQFKKMYPWHLGTALLFLLFGMSSLSVSDVPMISTNLLLLQSWVPDSIYYFSLNSVSWFLSDILFCYILFPTLYHILIEHRGTTVCIASIATVVVYLFFASFVPDNRVNDILYVSPALRWLDFSLGILTYRIVRSDLGYTFRLWLSRQKVLKASMIEALSLLVFVILYYVYECLPAWVRCSFLFWIANAGLLFLFYAADTGRGLVTRILHSRIAIYLGNISFHIFITHFILLRILLRFL